MPDNNMDKSNSERILYLLKTRGEQTATVLGELLGITMMGARQLLLSLEEQQLVFSRKKAQGRGRPKLFWSLTDKGHSRFPDRHADLTLSLITGIQQTLGGEAMEQLIAVREKQSLQDYQKHLKQHQNLKDKVIALADIRSQEGYMASMEEDEEGYLLVENHCPICAAAQACQGFCRSELEVFKQCLQADVERVEYMLEGARRCAYRIKPLTQRA
ncbi:helix-turn-helix transcriptional regulator [Kangiella shandongensis]|uniref:helix-turn-helix transcriptional regulator n=1 Tax=Kangiella shandongensis TaxID=2763258 RepID=UPI001CBEA041|nr:metalloregulator ArsR/SmtB family transcription factor [Kangiella shandongensis]